MKSLFKLFTIFAIFLFIGCKNNSEAKKTEVITTTVAKKVFTDAEKTAIVKYYLINERKLAEKDFFKIIFLNDFNDSVKVINYAGRDSYFTFKFSEALDFYTKNNNKE